MISMTEIVIDKKDNVIIVSITGELTISSSSDFKEKIHPLFQEKQSVIALDLGQITYIDSTGIGKFVEAINSAKVHKKELVFINLNAKVEETFNNVGLKSFFKIMSNSDFRMKYL